MFQPLEKYSAMNKPGVDILIHLAQIQMAALERVQELNLGVAKSAFEDSLNFARALMEPKDAQGAVSLSGNAMQSSMQKAMAYSKSMYEIATQVQGECKRLVDAQGGEVYRNWLATFQEFPKYAPFDSETVVGAMKSMMSAATSAYETQVTRLSEAAGAGREHKKRAA